MLVDYLDSIGRVRVEREKSADGFEMLPTDTSEFPVIVGVKDLSNNGRLWIQGKCSSLDFTRLTVSVEDSNSEKLETIHARYLVACDGAHSWTRRQLQVPTEARSERSTWGVIDIVPITDFRMHRLPTFSPNINSFL